MWIVFPLGFAIALLQADLFAGQAFRQLLSELANRPTPEGWHAIVADALDDPSLRLGYWDPAAGHFRDAEGGELARTAERVRRQWTEVRRDGLPVAALDTDVALAENPELVDAAASATLLAVETGGSRASCAPRRRARSPPPTPSGAGSGAISTTPPSSGCSPSACISASPASSCSRGSCRSSSSSSASSTRRSTSCRASRAASTRTCSRSTALAAALRSAVQSAAIPVSVTDEGLRRHSSAIELAVYFCCLEALQNVAKHAGPGASASVSLFDGDGELRFRVEDDGQGFEPSRVESGAGLSNLADRLSAVGGSIRIDSGAGRGTRVAGQIPV